MPLIGTKVHIAYPSGLELDAEYVSADEVRWQATAGPPAGRSGSNAMHLLEVAPDIYFANWLEDNGTSVSQLIDMNAQRITTFVTFDAPAGRTATYQEGTIRPY